MSKKRSDKKSLKEELKKLLLMGFTKEEIRTALFKAVQEVYWEEEKRK